MLAQQAYYTIGHVAAMLFLVAASAFFSGSETSFFNLTRRQIKQIGESKSRVHRLLSQLLKKPGPLLDCLLLGNMAVNVLYFTLASVLVLHVREQWGVTAATGVALLSFITIVLIADIFPKSLAYGNSWAVAGISALPAYLVVRVVGPAAFIARLLILEPFLRLALGHQRQPKSVTTSDLQALIDLSRQRGLIGKDETRLFTEVVELGFLKVRHVMQPRVDIVACDLSESPKLAVQMMQEHNFTKIPVYVRDIDRIVGLVRLRHILLRPETPLDRLVQPVQFVPEQKTVESLLEYFRKSRTDLAVVVDEYGGIAGVVHLEDIAEEIFGSADAADGVEPIQLLGPFQYRLSGRLAIHDWADVFGIDLTETRLATVGGLVTRLLGRMPRPGDVARMRNLQFTVETLRRHRIETVILNLEPLAGDGR
jgi:putative hemolysin